MFETHLKEVTYLHIQRHIMQVFPSTPFPPSGPRVKGSKWQKTLLPLAKLLLKMSACVLPHAAKVQCQPEDKTH